MASPESFFEGVRAPLLLDRTVIDAEAPLLVKVADLFDAKKTVSRSLPRINVEPEHQPQRSTRRSGSTPLMNMVSRRRAYYSRCGCWRTPILVRRPGSLWKPSCPGCSSFLRARGASMICRSSLRREQVGRRTPFHKDAARVEIAAPGE